MEEHLMTGRRQREPFDKLRAPGGMRPRVAAHLTLWAGAADAAPSLLLLGLSLTPSEERDIPLTQALALVAKVEELVLELADLLTVRDVVDDDVVVLLRDPEQLVFGSLELCIAKNVIRHMSALV
jgi:hypothetical protein